MVYTKKPATWRVFCYFGGMRPLFLFVFCMAAFNGFAQQLDVNIGPALPVGAYGSKDGSSESSGLAKLGWVGELSYSHAFKKGGEFGLMGTVRGRINGVSKDAAASPVTAAFKDYEWRVNSQRWKSAAVMAGPYFEKAISEKWRYRMALTAGVAKAWLPQIVVVGIQDSFALGGQSSMIQVSNKKTDATSFTFMFQTGVSYVLTSKLSLRASLDYWYMKPNFTIVQQIAVARNLIVPGVYNLSNGAAVSVNQVTGKYSQEMSTLNLTVGISMKL